MLKMLPTVYNLRKALYRKKMAAFDYDWTLVCPKNGKTFPSNIDDWEWLYPNIPNKIKKYYEDGYMIVIFTNQSKQWKHEQIKQVANSLEIPIYIVVSTDRSQYKPNTIMFDHLIGEYEIDKEMSFFVGDALGRKTDFANTDKQFAENIGVRCYSPEEMFTEKKESNEKKESKNIPVLPLCETPEIIIMMGYPGSGKSTIAKHICETDKYVHIEGDVYKTSAKMIKVSNEFIRQGKSIVFDATNSSCKKRKEYIDLGKKHGYRILCIHVSTTLEMSYKQNKQRDAEKQVPKIAYSVYKKHYEEPDSKEGFELVVLHLCTFNLPII